MSALELEARAGTEHSLSLEGLGPLTPVGRPGGQGRVYRPGTVPPAFAAAPIVVKIYRGASLATAQPLVDMVEWAWSLEPEVRDRLHRVAAWPLGLVTRAGIPAGIAMHDVTGRFGVPFVMPSGRRERVLLSLEHLLGGDDYLLLRGLGVRLGTAMRVRVAERISDALAFLHRQAIVACDIAPNNLLVGFGTDGPEVCFIDCDAMVFRGRQALPAVETADWQMPIEFSEQLRTREADAYKLGLIVLRLLARSHDARTPSPHLRHVPVELRPLLARALAREPANRPSAEEWQRALRALPSAVGLNHLYPGPPPKPRASATRPVRDVHTPSATPIWASNPRASAARSRPRQHPLTLAWVALVAVIFWLMLARLFGAAAPAQTGASLGSGGPSPAGNALPYYQYAPPGSFR